MLTVLTSGDREEVKKRLLTGPMYSAPPPAAATAIITWITALITSLLNFLSYFIGTLHNNIATILDCVNELEANTLKAPVAELMTVSPPHQLQCPTKQSRCSCCHMLGHNTLGYCTKDPVAVKK